MGQTVTSAAGLMAGRRRQSCAETYLHIWGRIDLIGGGLVAAALGGGMYSDILVVLGAGGLIGYGGGGIHAEEKSVRIR